MCARARVCCECAVRTRTGTLVRCDDSLQQRGRCVRSCELRRARRRRATRWIPRVGACWRLRSGVFAIGGGVVVFGLAGGRRLGSAAMRCGAYGWDCGGLWGGWRMHLWIVRSWLVSCKPPPTQSTRPSSGSHMLGAVNMYMFTTTSPVCVPNVQGSSQTPRSGFY